MPQPFEILDVDRLIQPVFLAQIISGGRIADIEEHGRQGVARNRSQHEKYEGGNNPHDDQGAECSFDKEAAHFKT